jgi:hypothetical protein
MHPSIGLWAAIWGAVTDVGGQVIAIVLFGAVVYALSEVTYKKGKCNEQEEQEQRQG